MKFSKSSWLILALGVVVMGAIMVYMMWSQQVQQRQDLETQIIATQKKLALLKIEDLITQKDQLLKNKELYIAQIAAAKTILAAPIDNIAATDAILKSAHDFDLKIVSINSNGKVNSTFAGNKFVALPFNVQVEGNIANIAGFVSSIKTLFPTSVVETYQFAIGMPTATTSPTAEITPTPMPIFPADTAATISVIIYDYKGDANVE